MNLKMKQTKVLTKNAHTLFNIMRRKAPNKLLWDIIITKGVFGKSTFSSPIIFGRLKS
jgi:hypothetical protein